MNYMEKEVKDNRTNRVGKINIDAVTNRLIEFLGALNKRVRDARAASIIPTVPSQTTEDFEDADFDDIMNMTSKSKEAVLEISS